MQAKFFLLLFLAICAGATLPLCSQAVRRGAAKSEFLPYTAQFKATLVQVLANGTTTTQISTITEARDSRGNTVAITTPYESGAEDRSFTIGHIAENATGTRMTWDSRTKKSQTLNEPSPEQRHGCWRSESGMTIYYTHERTDGSANARGGPASGSQADASGPLGSTQSESLGTTMIEGIEAHGVRLRTTIPSGRVGNDQPIESTTETWYAPSLGLVLRSSSENPPTGKLGKGKKDLISLDRHEPNPSLFQPPVGYEAVTDKMTPCKE